jgi:uncharacterized membrane protein
MPASLVGNAGMRRFFADSTSTSTNAGRVEAFSDGVMAIAITLLVLNIDIPAPDETPSGSALWESITTNWPDYLGYFVSFAIIGILWANHFHMFRLLGAVDHYTMLLNLLFLLCIGAIPYTTAVLTEHLGNEGERGAAILYGGWFLLTALIFLTLWRYASNPARRLLRSSVTELEVRQTSRRLLMGLLVSFLALGISAIEPDLGLVFWVIVLVVYLLPPREPAGS